MNFSSLITAVNNLYDDSMKNILAVSSNTSFSKRIINNYYIATGERLPDNTIFSIGTLFNNANKYTVVVCKADIENSINNTMYIDNEIVILCVIPEKYIEGHADRDDIINSIFKMYKYISISILNNTSPSITNIYNRVLYNMDVYLTVLTITSWYSISYLDISHKGIRHAFDKEKFEKIRDIDKTRIMDYQYLYGLLYNDKK